MSLIQSRASTRDRAPATAHSKPRSHANRIGDFQSHRLQVFDVIAYDGKCSGVVKRIDGDLVFVLPRGGDRRANGLQFRFESACRLMKRPGYVKFQDNDLVGFNGGKCWGVFEGYADSDHVFIRRIVGARQCNRLTICSVDDCRLMARALASSRRIQGWRR
jgi:hypothetical protein